MRHEDFQFCDRVINFFKENEKEKKILHFFSFRYG